jgi:hypothetical protein
MKQSAGELQLARKALLYFVKTKAITWGEAQELLRNIARKQHELAGGCEGIIGFESYREARKVARRGTKLTWGHRDRRPELVIYSCQFCGRLHLKEPDRQERVAKLYRERERG